MSREELMRPNQRATSFWPRVRMDAEGRRLCCWCGGIIQEKRRRTWCSQSCVNDYRVRSQPAYARHLVEQRDHGICQLCGSQCHGQDWQMDHILPVIKNGGSCGLDNLRTLCLPCHRRVTAELRRELADKRAGRMRMAL